MDRFDLECDTDWFKSRECSDSLAKDLGIEDNLNIGNTQGVMDSWRHRQVTAGFSAYPEVAVNGQVFSGSLNAAEVFGMICASLNDEKACVEQEKSDNGESGSFGAMVAMSIVLFLLILSLAFLIYRRNIKKEMTGDMASKVKELVSKYANKVNEHEKKRKEKIM